MSCIQEQNIMNILQCKTPDLCFHFYPTSGGKQCNWIFNTDYSLKIVFSPELIYPISKSLFCQWIRQLVVENIWANTLIIQWNRKLNFFHFFPQFVSLILVYQYYKFCSLLSVSYKSQTLSIGLTFLLDLLTNVKPSHMRRLAENIGLALSNDLSQSSSLSPSGCERMLTPAELSNIQLFERVETQQKDTGIYTNTNFWNIQFCI